MISPLDNVCAIAKPNVRHGDVTPHEPASMPYEATNVR